MAGTAGGGETAKDPSAWTPDLIHALMTQRFADVYRALDERDTRYEQRFQAQQDAIAKTDAATEKRFESVNEFRAQLTDQAREFMGRNESIQRHDATAEKIAALDKRLTEALALVNSRLDLDAGRGAGLERGWAYLVGVIGLAATVIGVVLVLTR